MDETLPETDSLRPERPRAREWLWRPWYAKAYLGTAFAYWSMFLASWLTSAFQEFFQSVAGAYANLTFHPLTVLIVLGAGFVRAFLSTEEWEWVEPEHDEMFPRRSIGGLSDPYSDPADPRSGTIWVGSPESRARLFGRKWP